MKIEEVIDLLPYYKNLKKEEKQKMIKIAKSLVEVIFDRQNEFFSNQKKPVIFDKNSEFYKNRLFKIYLGLMSEKLFQSYIMDKNIFDLTENDKISFSGLLDIEINEDEKIRNQPDKFDVEINGKKIDIKSSKNNQTNYEIQDFKQMCLTKRNFTMPLDQIKNDDLKDIVVQIMFNLKESNLKKGTYEVVNVYCFGGLPISDLIKNENLRNLKLNNNNYQKTYMKPLSFGKPIHELCNLKLKESDLQDKITSNLINKKFDNKI